MFILPQSIDRKGVIAARGRFMETGELFVQHALASVGALRRQKVLLLGTSLVKDLVIRHFPLAIGMERERR